MNDYVVVWDGRREGPGGAQLFTEEHARVHATKAPPRFRQPSSLSPKERRQVVEDTIASTYRETARKWGMSLAGVQLVVGSVLNGGDTLNLGRVSL